jgi:hypothetical protein
MTGLPELPLRLAVAQARSLPGDVAENARRAALPTGPHPFRWKGDDGVDAGAVGCGP